MGAVDRNGQQAKYSPTSNTGSSHNQIIDVVAPSHRAYSTQISYETFDVWTIDIPDAPGYNYVHTTDGGLLPTLGTFLPNSGTNYQAYTGHFGGTSAAAPQVSGIAALLLSAYPDLNHLQVAKYIQDTASNTTWNNQTGWGLVNAYDALIAPLAISGNGVLNWDYDGVFTVPAIHPSAGITFNGWTLVVNNSYVVTGGTTSPTLNVRFTTLGQGTIFANYTLPGGVPLTRSIAVRTYYIPTITHNASHLIQGTTVTFTALHTLSNVTCLWEVVSGGTELSSSGNSFQVQAGYDSALKVRCRLLNMQNGYFGDWATIELPVYSYSPAPAPQENEGTIAELR